MRNIDKRGFVSKSSRVNLIEQQNEEIRRLEEKEKVKKIEDLEKEKKKKEDNDRKSLEEINKARKSVEKKLVLPPEPKGFAFN